MRDEGIQPGPTAGPISVATNLRLDEMLLRRGRTAARSAELGEIAVTVGVGVPEDAAYLARARERGIGVHRRTTGGSGVLHLPGDLVWSVVRERTDPVVGPDYTRGYSRLGVGVVDFLRANGVDARWAPAPALTPDLCVLSGRGEVLTVGSRVLGGAAQHATSRALLHHGMIARHVDRSMLRTIFGVGSPATDRLVGLDELGLSGSLEGLGSGLERWLEPDQRDSAARRRP